MEALHVVNTEIAESTFAQLRRCTGTLRSLSPYSAQMFLSFKVDFINRLTLFNAGGVNEPQGLIGKRWSPCQTLPMQQYVLEF